MITNKTGKGGFGDNSQNINKKGRPRTGQALTDIMREVLEEELPSGKLRKEALVRKVLELAYEGNESMIRMAWGYLEGMPTQRQEVTIPLPIEIITSNKKDIQEFEEFREQIRKKSLTNNETKNNT